MQGKIHDRRDLEQSFTKATTGIDAVIHFAGLKPVGEPVKKPLLYWDVNVNGSRSLLGFSSSVTLLGHPETVPIPEKDSIAPINPYGHTRTAI